MLQVAAALTPPDAAAHRPAAARCKVNPLEVDSRCGDVGGPALNPPTPTPRSCSCPARYPVSSASLKLKAIHLVCVRPQQREASPTDQPLACRYTRVLPSVLDSSPSLRHPFAAAESALRNPPLAEALTAHSHSPCLCKRSVPSQGLKGIWLSAPPASHTARGRSTVLITSRLLRQHQRAIYTESDDSRKSCCIQP